MLPPRLSLLSVELQRQVQTELRAGERQVWAAQPLPGAFRRQSIAVVLFGLPFTGFALFWIVTAGWGVWGHANHAPGPFVLFPLFGLPFLLIGLGMLTSPFWMAKRAARTVYVLTDQRAIVVAGKVFGGVTVQSFEPARLTSITRNERPDGTGDLIFEQFTQRQGTGTTTVRRGFMGIDDVRQVEDLIHSTLLARWTRAV